MEKILIDGRLLSERETGISRYTKEIINGFIRTLGKENVYVLVNDKHWGTFYSNILICKFKPFNLIHFFFFYFWILRNTKNFGIFLAPFYSLFPFRIPSLFTVTTVHDLMYRIVPSFFTQNRIINFVAKKYYDLIVRSSILNSNYVVSVSKKTQEDLTSAFGVKSVVFSEGINHLGALEELNCLDISANIRALEDRSFYLYVGNLRPHKNISFLINSFLDSKVNDLLVIVGNYKKNSVDTILPTNSNVVFFNYVSDKELAFLYSKCLAFVFPSLYEGFGLPILEALSYNAKIVSSNAGALSEFSESFVKFFNPSDKEELMKIFTKKDFVNYDIKTRARIMLEYDWSRITQDLSNNILEVSSS